MAEHGIELVEGFDETLDLDRTDPHRLGHLLLPGRVLRQELVKRRVEKANRARPTFQRLENADEVLSLQRQEFAERPLVLRDRVGGLLVLPARLLQRGQLFDPLLLTKPLHRLGDEDQPSEGDDPVSLEEHVLGSAEADPLGAEFDRDGGVVRGVGVRADAQPSILVGELHDRAERAGQARFDRFDLPLVDDPARSVERDPVALLDRHAVAGEALRLVVDLDVADAGNAARAHPARHDRGVRRHPAPRGQDPGGDGHPADVLRARLGPAEDHAPSVGGPAFGVLGGEDDPAGGSARRRGESDGDLLRLLLGGLDEHRMQELVERRRIDPEDGLLFADSPLLDQVGRDPDRRLGRPLSVPRLENVEGTVLDRELEVLHVLVVPLELHADRVELLERLRHHFLERREARPSFLLADAVGPGPRAGALERDLLRRANAGDDILALRIDEVLAIEVLVCAGRRVAGESDAGRRVLATVAEDHRLDVDRRPEEPADVVQLAILDRARVVPGSEDGLDSCVQLVRRASRERLPGRLLVDLLVALDDLGEALLVEIGVGLRSVLLLHRVELVLEGVMFDAHHDVAEHLDEPAIGVENEARVSAQGNQRLDRRWREAKVEDGVHHPGHRDRGTGPDRQEQRIRALPERLSRRLLEPLERRLDLRLQRGEQLLLPEPVVGVAGLSRTRKPRRNREAEARHLGEIRPLAPQQLPHPSVSLGSLLAEGVDVLHPRCTSVRAS